MSSRSLRPARDKLWQRAREPRVRRPWLWWTLLTSARRPQPSPGGAGRGHAPRSKAQAPARVPSTWGTGMGPPRAAQLRTRPAVLLQDGWPAALRALGWPHTLSVSPQSISSLCGHRCKRSEVSCRGHRSYEQWRVWGHGDASPEHAPQALGQVGLGANWELKDTSAPGRRPPGHQDCLGSPLPC